MYMVAIQLHMFLKIRIKRVSKDCSEDMCASLGKRKVGFRWKRRTKSCGH